MIIMLDYILYYAFISKQVPKLSSLHLKASNSKLQGLNCNKTKVWRSRAPRDARLLGITRAPVFGRLVFLSNFARNPKF
ncbi:hypothetical protein HanIR_Chr13g0641801 [Helianthus annuus]|nr:hypothetical protein HanIR_Chr13g0641801 [Helianthus annuus]